ncbi:uncharacterized protein LOC128272008 isoform X1 [Anopheles cruzii]|uniref:uncharacterized protein LOC128272008 isoform X1 n=1 Tax=Anopheles cruzii TaxID=68878 RepID=UPI0022EC84CD|nr:uncharacterized protein LOC128272008 isoform X1 [Anopheles cruzii]XP_052865685.1 uncharacterized protein LOC128272008 isoform X1 [Anopheles cruzii]
MFDCTAGPMDSADLLRFAKDAGCSMCTISHEGNVMLCEQVDQLFPSVYNRIFSTVVDSIQKLKIVGKKPTTSEVRTERLVITRSLQQAVCSWQIIEDEKPGETLMLLNDILPRLNDPMLKYDLISNSTKEITSYELFHGALEWRWLLVLLTNEVKKKQEESGRNWRKIIELTKLFAQLYREMMIDLLGLVVQFFENHRLEEIVDNCQFNCDCVSLMWFGMMALAEQSEERLNFWCCFDESIQLVVNDPKQRCLLKVWLIHTLAELCDEALFRDMKATGISLAALAQIPCIIAKLLAEFPLVNLSEQQLRVFLLLIKPFTTGFWAERPDVVTRLWDYFASRFDTLCLNTTASSARSPSLTDFIQQSQALVVSELSRLDLETTSLSIFINLLTFTIDYFTKKADERMVHIIFSRIFVGLSFNKYSNTTEQAIYNICLLITAILNAISGYKIFPRVFQHINMIPITCGQINTPVATIIGRVVMATQVHMAVLVHLGSTNYNKTMHVQRFLRCFHKALSEYAKDLLPAMVVISEGMLQLYKQAQTRGSYALGEVYLIDTWITKYLEWSGTNRYQLLHVIATGMQEAATSKQFIEAINRHVFQFVHQKFSEPRSVPPCIAQIAAYLTINEESSRCVYGMSDSPILRMFITFAKCRTAHWDQRLDYITLVVTIGRVGDLSIRLLIQQWLQLCFIHNNEKMRKFSQVIRKTREFKMLCDIPEYDLLETSEEPITLFFRYVGERYHETSGRKRLQLKERLVLLFEDLSEWMPKSDGILRKRFLTVLVSALNECPEAFYNPSCSQCVFQKAFTCYFLPFDVFSTLEVSLDYVVAIAGIWNRVLDILAKMSYNTDLVINKYITNMLIKWLPQFAKLPKSNDAVDPLMQFFCGTNETIVRHGMPCIASEFIELVRCRPRPNTRQGLLMVQWLLEALMVNEKQDKVVLFIGLLGYPLLEHSFKCDPREPQQTREIATKLVFHMITYADQCDTMYMAMREVLLKFTREFMLQASKACSSFLLRLAEKSPDIIRSMTYILQMDLINADMIKNNENESMLKKAVDELMCKLDQLFDNHDNDFLEI